MSEIDFTGVALVITAIGTVVTAIGIAIVAIMAARQKIAVEKQTVVLQDQTKVIQQVEKQGNSVSLELKRTNMVLARQLADGMKSDVNEARANDAQKIYEEARKQAEMNANLKT